jgi:hypothetical protein
MALFSRKGAGCAKNYLIHFARRFCPCSLESFCEDSFMASFVPHHTKKRERLARLEQDLLRSIRGDSSRDTQLRLVDEIRLARIRVLRVERANFLPSAIIGSKRYAAIEAQISALDAISPEGILSEFLVQATRPHDVSA